MVVLVEEVLQQRFDEAERVLAVPGEEVDEERVPGVGRLQAVELLDPALPGPGGDAGHVGVVVQGDRADDVVVVFEDKGQVALATGIEDACDRIFGWMEVSHFFFDVYLAEELTHLEV